ncbi:hypothetical protein HPB47_003994 [Ixodes persulcatus]|uniref:Uncharacterized protein n=1 Tax=Ixodes persulcatus TaxID=34615 RepID=A0AC60PH06_IXOPE|nr:hypothetical protein HPB47_003994 [Ixodes persulcatus]
MTRKKKVLRSKFLFSLRQLKGNRRAAPSSRPPNIYYQSDSGACTGRSLLHRRAGGALRRRLGVRGSLHQPPGYPSMEPTGQATGNQGTDVNTMPELENMNEVQGKVHTNNTPGNDESQSAEDTNFPTWIKILSRKQQRLQNQAYRKTLEESRRNDEQPPSGKMPTGAKTRQTPKPQKRQHPPLPIEDYKVVVRPLDGLNLGTWGPDQLTPVETAEIKTRLRKDQNLAIVSTSSVDTLERLCNISFIALGETQFRVKPYAAMPDDSCKGSEWLTEELNARNSNCIVLNTRMMGSTTSAIITFHGLRVPRLVYIDGGEFECRVYRPKKQVCTKCLRLGRREDTLDAPQGRELRRTSRAFRSTCSNNNKAAISREVTGPTTWLHRFNPGRRPRLYSPRSSGHDYQRGDGRSQNPYDLLPSEALDSSPALTGPQSSDTRSGSKQARSRSKARSRSRSRARSQSRLNDAATAVGAGN